MKSNTFEMMQKRIVHVFLDIIILKELRKHPLSGYDIISLIHKKFHILLSSGTAYSYLYALERNGFIRGTYLSRRRTYTLTDSGKQTIDELINLKDKISRSISIIFKNGE